MTIDLPDVFRPLAGQLYRRLEFRQRDFSNKILEVQAICRKEGLSVSGVLVRRLNQAFADEAQTRVNLIEQELRKYRLSCSPNQIIAGREALGFCLQQLVRQTFHYLGNECEEVIRVFLNVDANVHTKMLELMRKEASGLLRNCIDLTMAIVDEVVMAAETEAQAKTEPDRPSYVYQNVFYAAVASIAQGGASVGQISQVNQKATALDDLIVSMRASIATWPIEHRRSFAGAEAALIVESNSENPDKELVDAAIKKLARIAEAIESNVETQALLFHLRTHSWI